MIMRCYENAVSTVGYLTQNKKKSAGANQFRLCVGVIYGCIRQYSMITRSTDAHAYSGDLRVGRMVVRDQNTPMLILNFLTFEPYHNVYTTSADISEHIWCAYMSQKRVMEDFAMIGSAIFSHRLSSECHHENAVSPVAMLHHHSTRLCHKYRPQKMRINSHLQIFFYRPSSTQM